ncbi:MAG: response regulator transcription factor [Candidatus Krumholzibacteriia bacterium]
MAHKVLVVEDDLSIVEGLRATLEAEGYEVECATDGPSGFEKACRSNASLVVLDIMLPGMSGLEIAKKLRDGGHRLPIILLTAKAQEDDRILGLELGADDYVTKPFSVRELLARVRSVLRRTVDLRGERPRHYRFGNVTVDFKRQGVKKDDRPLELSAREFRILSYFIEHAGEMLSREQLLNRIWGYDVFPTTRTVDNHIARLRKKIEDEPEAPRFILTVRGAGYVFEPGGGDAIQEES